jgi:hypothetical protein
MHITTVKSGRHGILVSDVVVVNLAAAVDIEAIAVATTVDTPEGAGPEVVASVLYDGYPFDLLPDMANLFLSDSIHIL